MRASIISVGTELTNGQILNKNAQWLAQKLDQYGIITDFQISTADDHATMLQALNLCVNTELLFVTGGLGPTTDDFTRDVVAKWANASLQFHQPSWDSIERALKMRGIPVREMQKQQCYFPENAKVLTNAIGTANGFQFTHNKQEIFVLPGPPREIASIWQDHIAGWLTKSTQNLDPWLTFSWDTLGLGESEIAFKTEEALKNYKINKSYRVHLPYVEVKLSLRKSELAQLKSALENVDLALASWTVTRNNEDIAKSLFDELKSFSNIFIYDSFSNGFFHQRIKEEVQTLKPQQHFTFSTQATFFPTGAFADSVTIELAEKNTEIILSLSVVSDYVERKLEIKIQTPFDSKQAHAGHPLAPERRRQFASELAIIEIYKFLSQHKKDIA